ncbi:MAG TPA: hypothetical protein VFX62_02690 [Erythrobacter sp.]|nr:hypothetical protein [Erythrobacter sp.]
MAGLALFNLLSSLADLGAKQQHYEALMAGFPWTRDWTIVATSAWFTVELIPAALVWLLASRFARWLIATVVLLGTVQLAAGMVALTPWSLAGLGLRAAALALLFLPMAQPWFNHGRRLDAALP